MIGNICLEVGSSDVSVFMGSESYAQNSGYVVGIYTMFTSLKLVNVVQAPKALLRIFFRNTSHNNLTFSKFSAQFESVFLTLSRHSVVERGTLVWHIFVLLLQPKDSAGFLYLLLNACFQPLVIFHKVLCLRCDMVPGSTSCICLWNLPAGKDNDYFVSSIEFSFSKLRTSLLTLPAPIPDEEKT